MFELEKIKEKIQQIAVARDIDESKAFAFFFLNEVHDLSDEEAERVVIDGPWDGGLDAFYYDDENKKLYLYQFKYTENCEYAITGISDLVRYVRNIFKNISDSIEIKNTRINIDAIDSVKVSLVTLAKLHNINGKTRKDYEKEKTRNLRSFFSRMKLNIESKFEIFDYYKIEEIYVGVAGIPEAIFDISEYGCLQIQIKENLGDVDIIVAPLKGEELADLCEKHGDDLLESNVRRFLGLRKGSINWYIMKTLEDSNERPLFIAYNNGIVAVCKNFKIDRKNKKLFVERFAIVNGAQTVNVLLKAREKNFDFSNVYILSKIVRTQKWDIAANIARAANSQNPTNVRDLRSLDKVHEELAKIFENFGYTYVYKRGLGVRGKNKINMKDLAQAYVAFYMGEPHIAYSRVDKIFSDNKYYDEIFNYEKIEEAKKVNKIESLVINYIVPYELLMMIRKKLRNREKRPIDPAFTYHILWVFGGVFHKAKKTSNIEDSKKLVKDLFEKYFDRICNEFKSCVTYREDIEIPRSLKSSDDLQKFIKVKENIVRTL